MADDLKVQVTDFLPEFAKLAHTVNFKEAFPHTLAALNIMAHKTMVQWRQATMGNQLPGMPFPVWSRGDYTRSIDVNLSNDELKYVYGDGKKTTLLENGHGEIDLKPGLLSGTKARQGKFGPYNIISFRHGMPGTLPSNNPMPQGTYNFIKKQAQVADNAYKQGQARKAGTSQVVNGKAQWGVKLPAAQGGIAKTKHTSIGDYTWSTGKYTGMVKQKAGAGNSSQYRTFRVVSYKSDPASWIVPPQDANPIRQSVVNSLSDEFKTLLKMAMEDDLK